MKNLLFLVIILFFSSCNANYKNESKQFIEYMKDSHGLLVDDDENYCFVIIPEFACIGCVTNILFSCDFQRLFPEYKVSFILSNESEHLNMLYSLDGIEVYFDEKNEIDDLFYSFANMGILLFEKGVIGYIENVSDKNDILLMENSRN